MSQRARHPSTHTPWLAACILLLLFIGFVIPNRSAAQTSEESFLLDTSLLALSGANDSSVPVSFSPRDGASMVMPSEIVRVRISASQSAFAQIAAFTLTCGGQAVSGAITQAPDSRSVSFSPNGRLLKNTACTARLVATVWYNNANRPIDRTWRFTTINPSDPAIVFYKDFDSDPRETYTIDTLKARWGLIDGTPAGIAERRVQIMAGDTARQGNMLRIRYLANQFGPGDGGTQWYRQVGQYDELYISYWVKFKADFDFVRGGKLPGLRGNKNDSGRPNGTNYFSARIMWRPNGKVVQYVYHMDQPNVSGQDFDWTLGGQRYFKPGQWHKVETYIRLNTPGRADGIIQSWFDGELALDRRTIRFRSVSSLKINLLHFASFFGGSDTTWAPNKDEYAYIDNFVIATRPITH